MYFNRNEPVYQNSHYEKLIRNISKQLHIRNSCILTQAGISSIENIEQYLDWVHELGVREVVFRELSKVDENYVSNPTRLWVDANKVSIDTILESVMPSLIQKRPDWEYTHSKTGYYYYNESFRYKNSITVILETSSYTELINRNNIPVIQKLIFHSNGNLCGDWDPDSQVLGNYF